ncbi:MAG TPA: hypothetical protein VEX17_02435, partial [Bacillales bacterium]|nr:hypothetical protein [Bacillales bacterium]
LPFVIYPAVNGLKKENLNLLKNLFFITILSIFYTLFFHWLILGTFSIWALSIVSVIILSLLVFFTGLLSSEKALMKKMILSLKDKIKDGLTKKQ